MRFYSAVLSKNIILHIQKLGRIGGELYTLLLRSFERKHVHWADNVYASVQKASAKTSFCVYRSLRVCEGQCVRICAESSQRKHDFAYTNTGASARGDVYAFMQKPSVKASFCVYRSLRVCEGRCIRFCIGALSESIILRIQKPTHLREALYTLLFKNLQRNRHFTYTLCRLSRGYLYMDYFVPADCHPKRPPVPSKKAY